ncbi:hypothetical protein ABPG77_002431 [Micractinium sp. CCAP 211/92]
MVPCRLTARRLLLLTAVGVAALAAPAVSEVASDAGSPGLLQVLKLSDGTVLQIEQFSLPTKASALAHLFSSASVEVHCVGHANDLHVFSGPSVAAVRRAYDRGERSWCGLRHRLRESPNCTVSIPPRGATLVAVAKPRAWLAGADDRSCQMERRLELSWGRLVAFLLGSWLFWSAGALSESTPFRLTGGTLGVMMLSVLILLFFLYRTVPHKGKVFAGAAVFGSSFLAAVRWMFGVWLPSAHQVMTHPVTLAYLALSGLAGLATTYYYNNPENRKLNTMLRVALQLVGLTSVYFSSSMTETSVALCAALLAAKAWDFLQQHRSMREALATAKRSVQQQLGAEGADAGAGQGAGGPTASQKVHKTVEHTKVQHTTVQQQYRTPTVPGGTAGERASAAEVSPLIQRGLILNEETGHIIGIGKATYNRLVDSGYVVDRFAGTITPPPPSPDSPARTSRGNARSRRRHTP